jgi:hypothetical protein
VLPVVFLLVIRLLGFPVFLRSRAVPNNGPATIQAALNCAQPRNEGKTESTKPSRYKAS